MCSHYGNYCNKQQERSGSNNKTTLLRAHENSTDGKE
jgi:hypothetical protein